MVEHPDFLGRRVVAWVLTMKEEALVVIRFRGPQPGFRAVV